MSRKAVVLMSGGLDSTTTVAIARDHGFDIHAMTFSYGQRHRIEVEKAVRLAKVFRIAEHKIIEIDLRIFGSSALTSDMEVPKKRTLDEMGTSIPITYVPARNTIFLAYALAYAEVLNCFDIFIGVHSLDYSGYPDCRPEFIQAFQNLSNLATKHAVESENSVLIHTPLIGMNKAQIIATGVSLGVDFSLTSSCYDPSPQGLACGACDSCQLRRNGFLEAGIPDPTLYG